ncbi:MAG: mechanosensitive ion channel protein MscS [Deltaproteobacteria bacterium RBG_13_61_14]|nr:MAG: mechanosensitive ion channel protein MscS [Deltaproteobacteria bacterium RBG_13_61_14]
MKGWSIESLPLPGWLITHSLRIGLILLLAGAGLWLLSFLIHRLSKRMAAREEVIETTKRMHTISQVIRSIGVVTIVAVTIMLVLSELGIDMKPLLAAAGIGGLAIGFGAQSLVKDVISGFFLILENQVRVGDVVQISGVGGVVESITLRILTLRDLAGNVHIIPHGQISQVQNMTRDYSRYVFDVGVSYREDVDRVMEVLRQLGAELEQDPDFGPDILEPFEILGLDRFEDSAVIIRARIKTQPIQQWRVAREMNRRIKKRFDELGIEIPFPHRTLYWGEPKTGEAPPLRVVKRDG